MNIIKYVKRNNIWNVKSILLYYIAGILLKNSFIQPIIASYRC